MSFVIKDLMITILPKILDPGVFGPCDAGSYPPPPGPPPSPPSPPPPGPDAGGFDFPVNILELRMLLQFALAQLGGPLRDEEMRPRSISDLDALAEKLGSALEEVRGIRARFGATAPAETVAESPTPFVIKDLMVTVMPPGILERLEPCDAGTALPPGGPPPPPPGPDAIALDPRFGIQELRMLLQFALAQAGGPMSVEETRPRSLTDLDALGERLASAMEEVQEIRARFTGMKSP